MTALPLAKRRKAALRQTKQDYNSCTVQLQLYTHGRPLAYQQGSASISRRVGIYSRKLTMHAQSPTVPGPCWGA